MAAGMVTMASYAEAQQKVEPITARVGGYHWQFFGVNGSQSKNFNGGRGKDGPTDVKSDSEIWFLGRTTLANGITFGFDVQLEANTSADQIDESFMFIEGAFGRVLVGSENNAAYLMNYQSPEGGVGIGFQEGPSGGNWVGNFTGSGQGDSTFSATNLRFFDNDSEKLTYFTPRMAGFQAGLSYIPHASQDIQGQNQTRVARLTAAGANQAAPAAYHQGWAGGLNFVQTVGGVNVAVAGGYMRWNADETPVTAAGLTVPDPHAWSAGFNLGYMGFVLGGSFADISKGRGGAGTSVTRAVDGRGWDLGLSYTWGPAAVALSYYSGKNEDLISQPADDKHRSWHLSGSYTLGPGVALRGTIFHTRYEDEEEFNPATGAVFAGGAAAAVAPGALDNKGAGAVISIRLGF
ncbi:MAG: porin [Pseudomonadota bacterium]